MRTCRSVVLVVVVCVCLCLAARAVRRTVNTFGQVCGAVALDVGVADSVNVEVDSLVVCIGCACIGCACKDSSHHWYTCTFVFF